MTEKDLQKLAYQTCFYDDDMLGTDFTDLTPQELDDIITYIVANYLDYSSIPKSKTFKKLLETLAKDRLAKRGYKFNE